MWSKRPASRNNEIAELRKAWRSKFIKSKIKNRGYGSGSKDRKEKSKDFLPEENLFTKLGASDQFNDSILDVSYDWDTRVYKNQFEETTERRLERILTLKDLSAIKIAENSEFLTEQLLRTGNWQQWKLVWHYISLFNSDTFAVFNMFATLFSNEQSFSCHDDILSYPPFKKNVILTSTLPNSQNHRVERLFGNINISQLVKSLNRSIFQNVVYLEISSSRVTQPELLELTNLKNLASLKIAKVRPSDSTIHTWCTSLRSQKWQKLQILAIPEVSKLSVMKLQEAARSCQLMYIELLQESSSSYLNLRRDWTELDYVSWNVFSDSAMNELCHGMQTIAIQRKFKISEHTLNIDKDTIILDFHIMDHVIGTDDSSYQDDFLWSSRPAPAKHSQALVLKNKLVLPSSKKRSLDTNTKKKPLKKLQKVSMKSFFDL